MTALEAIPAEVLSRLQTTLTTETSLIDMGSTEAKEAAAAALEGNATTTAKGRCFIVAPLVNLTRRDAAGGKQSNDVGVLVLFRCRPEKVKTVQSLTTDAQLAAYIYALLRAALAAVIAPQSTTQPHDRYLPSDQPLALDDSDSGEIRYRLTFLKQTVF